MNSVGYAFFRGAGDGDGAGAPDSIDNCPAVANSEQLDQDGDAISRTPGDLFGETQDLVDVGATDVTIALATRNEETKPGMQIGASAPPVPGTGHP